jgi:hypothetical protein
MLWKNVPILGFVDGLEPTYDFYIKLDHKGNAWSPTQKRFDYLDPDHKCKLIGGLNNASPKASRACVPERTPEASNGVSKP